MLREDPVVHWEHTILCHGLSLKFGVATTGAFCFQATGTGSNPDPDPGSTDSPFSNPLIDAPLFVRDVCSMHSLSDTSRTTVGGTKTSLQTNDVVRILIVAHPQPRVPIWRE